MNRKDGTFMKKFFGEKKREKLILLAAAGLLLLVIAIPTGPREKQDAGTETGGTSAQESTGSLAESYEKKLEKRLKEVLSTLEGAGKTEVMITLRTSEELRTLQNTVTERNTLRENDAAGGSRDTEEERTEKEMLVLNSADGGEETVVYQTVMPQIEGIVVCCEGGDKATVIKEITEAVQALFDVPSHKIKVLKRS